MGVVYTRLMGFTFQSEKFMGFKFQGYFLGLIFQSSWDSGLKFQMGGIQDSNYVFRGPHCIPNMTSVAIKGQ